ncbi:hypothetical protein ACTXT7_015287 [Hymenolepis weldensis]
MTSVLPPSLNIFIFLDAQFCAYEIANQQVRFTCLLTSLTPEVIKLVYDFREKPSTTPYDDLKFILERIEEPEIEHTKWLLAQHCNKLLNADTEEP